MAYSTKMVTCSSLRAECHAMDFKTPYLEPDIETKLAVRIAYLSPQEKTDLHLASHYCLTGEIAVVLAVLPAGHPMGDLFTVRGAPTDVRAVEYVRHTLQKQSLQNEISKLESQRF